MAKKLTTVAIRNHPGGKLFDTGGLFIDRKGDGGKWTFRYTHLGKRREMGLGSWPELGLGDARKLRDQWAAVLRSGRDPIQEREKQRLEEIADRDKVDPTFAELVDIVFEAKKAGLRGEGKRGRWRSPIDRNVIPTLGKRRISAISAIDIRDTVAPIWRTKHPTALKAMQTTRVVFSEGRLMGFPCDPFTVDSARRMLGEYHHETKHIPATDWREIPALYERLDAPTSSARCLRWMILTGVRAHAGRGARVSEVEGDVWVLPAERVKGRQGKVKDFRIPLAPPALAMVEEVRALGFDLLFPGRRGVSPITDRAIEKHLDELGEPGRPHGFRTAFRSWVQDTDACSWEVAETILGHIVGSRVERSYARSDLLERRRPVMEAWARFVTGEEASEVVRIRG